MPQITSNINTLVQMRKEIEEQSKASVTFAVFNKEKIARFYKLNAIRLKAADDKINSMIKKLVKQDENGNAVKEKGEDGVTRFIYNNEDDQVTFEIDYKNYMERGCSIEY
jgi:hypothetical protein